LSPSPAQPHVVLIRQLRHAVAALVHRHPTALTGDQLVTVIVHVTVTHTAAVTSPADLGTA
jgi:hypothetical protein